MIKENEIPRLMKWRRAKNTEVVAFGILIGLSLFVLLFWVRLSSFRVSSHPFYHRHKTVTYKEPLGGMLSPNLDDQSNKPLGGLLSPNLDDQSNKPLGGLLSPNLDDQSNKPPGGLLSPNLDDQSNKPPGGLLSPNLNDQSNKPLGGLLSPNFDNQSCMSRYRSSLYRKSSPLPLSPYLIQRLRSYEEHHKKCGPLTESYQKAVEQLKSGKNFEYSDCQYLVSTQTCGIGNRMLSLVSAFLFSLLTNRVLLIDMTNEMHDLFCEPFPESSWVLPSDFPIKDFWKLNKDSPESYTFMAENKIIGNNANVSAESLPPYVFLDLGNQGLRLVNHIFCENDQKLIQKMNWIIVRSDSYYAVALFLMRMYAEELENMFPVKESVFYHLGRYLFHPSNPVWEIIDKSYKQYLANYDKRVGLQIRIFPQDKVPLEKMFERTLDCLRNMTLLPDQLGVNNSSSNHEKLVILVLSLYSEYYDNISKMYRSNSAMPNDRIFVYQPSHEEEQKTNNKSHNQQALAEIFLLSYCDKMAITSWSTFGYVGHSLAGIKPWIIRTPGWLQNGLRPTCVRPESVEPCLHSPPILKCNGKEDLNAAKIEPFVRPCEDVPTGLKLFGYGGI